MMTKKQWKAPKVPRLPKEGVANRVLAPKYLYDKLFEKMRNRNERI